MRNREKERKREREREREVSPLTPHPFPHPRLSSSLLIDPGWPGPTSPVKPFLTTLQAPSDPPAPEVWSPLRGTFAVHPIRTKLTSHGAPTAVVLGLGAHQNHMEGLLEHNGPTYRVLC